MPLAAIDQVPPTEWNGVIVARANHTQDKESCAEPAATCRYVSGLAICHTAIAAIAAGIAATITKMGSSCITV